MADPVLDAMDALDDAVAGMLGVMLLLSDAKGPVEAQPIATLLRLVLDRLEPAVAELGRQHMPA